VRERGGQEEGQNVAKGAHQKTRHTAGIDEENKVLSTLRGGWNLRDGGPEGVGHAEAQGKGKKKGNHSANAENGRHAQDKKEGSQELT